MSKWSDLIYIWNAANSANKKDVYTKSEVDALLKKAIDDVKAEINKVSGGKSNVFLTQDEYDTLSEEQKNDDNIVYNIIDAVETLTVVSPNGTQYKIVVNDDGSLASGIIKK